MRQCVAVVVAGVLLSSGASSARLVLVQEVKNGVAGVVGLEGARGVAISPDGLNVYAVAIFDNSLTAFERDSHSGRLAFRQSFREGVDGVSGLVRPIQITVAPDGRSVYVVSAGDVSGGKDAVTLFQRSPDTGHLQFVETKLDVGAAHGTTGNLNAIAISPDGHNVYCGTASAPLPVGGVLINYERDPSTGTLTDVGFIGGLPTMRDLASLAVSPAGDFVYGMGALTFVRFARSGDGNLVFDWAHPAAPSYLNTGAVATRGDAVFAAVDLSIDSGVVIEFSPAAPPVTLDFAGVLTNTAIRLARAIALHPTRELTFVGGLGSGVGVVTSDSVDGLALSDLHDSPAPVVFSLAVSPDGRHIYAAGATTHNIAVFRILTDQLPVEVPAMSAAGCALLFALLALAMLHRQSLYNRRG